MKRLAAALSTVLMATFCTAWAGATTASAATTTTLRLMPRGDSITWGVGSSTGNGYRGPLWNELVGAKPLGADRCK